METIDIDSRSQDEIKTMLRENKISLTLDELKKIQKEILHRPPTISECVLWSIQGSEHCSYKSSRKYLKQFVTAGEDVILGPSEDAGIVAVAKDNSGLRYGVVVSHESHNHPSQIVPYEGAATGIGGNVRDVSCMGARVVANADPLRFGDINTPKSRWVYEGVVSGIAGYGNPIGIPVIAGDAYFDSTYNENCLVNIVSLGVIREDEIIHSKAPKNSDGYNLILVGKPTDNSGFGGASFASLTLKEEEKDQNKGAVQEPNAFLKRHLLKAHYELFKILKQKQLIEKVGFKDLGAGGIACAAVELADHGGYGAEIELESAPTSMKDLNPAVILCSETQERYMWVAPEEATSIIVEHYNKTFELSEVAKGAMATVIGKIKEHKNFIVRYGGNEIVNAPASAVTRGLVYDRPITQPKKNLLEPALTEPLSYNETFLSILYNENVASKEPIYERYDKQVQGNTIIEPGEADAGLIQPFNDTEYPEEIRAIGIALSVDQNPRYCKVDSYWGAINAVMESIRNVAAIGASPIAITDCLNFGNPEKPNSMWEFAEGARGVSDACKHLVVPIISGNVSLYNESESGAIAPSPIIACIGRIKDASKAITMHFKKPESLLFMIGERKDECGGSVYYSLNNELGKTVPKPDLADVEKQIKALSGAIEASLILAAHDISDGGIAVTIAEMSFGNEIGCDAYLSGLLRSDKLLFSETGGFVVEIAHENGARALSFFRERGVELRFIGKTTSEKRLKMNGFIDIDLLIAKQKWSEGLREKL